MCGTQILNTSSTPRFTVFALVGLVAWAFNPSFARLSGDFIYNLLTFNPLVIETGPAAPSGMYMLFGFFVLIWIPMTHMGHLIFKYFTYHDIRWGDTPPIEPEEREDEAGPAVQGELGCRPHQRSVHQDLARHRYRIPKKD